MGSLDTSSVVAMRGDGEYNCNSDFQRRALVMGMEYVKDPPQPSETVRGKPLITICDYGCSQGLNSSAIWIQAVLSKQPNNVNARIILQDTPWNDWNSVSQTFRTHFATLSAKSLRTIFPERAPGSFFEQCLPDSSIDIGTAWSSAHWLSRDPIPLATDASPEEVLSKFCRHDFEGAHSDLVRFLKCRARETRPNGIFTACLLAHYTDETNQSTRNQPGLKMASIMARNQLIEEGKLSKELTRVVLPCHKRSREEMEAAFEEVKDDWIVEEMKEDHVVHPAYDQLVVELKAGMGEEAFRSYAQKVSTWWIAIVGGMLTKIAMPKETAEAKKILDEFTERAAQVFLERSKDEPAMNKFWFLRLRRKQTGGYTCWNFVQERTSADPPALPNFF